MGCALKVHRALGPGLLESAYEACLARELDKARLKVQRQVLFPLVYDGEEIGQGYRIDLLVEEKEIKAVEQLTDVHRAQVLSYLRLGRYRLGYLLNFNVGRLTDGIRRLANGL